MARLSPVIDIYADEDSMRGRVIREVRAAGIPVLTTAEAGQLGRSDAEQLSFALANRMCIFTSNQGDFARLHHEWMVAGRTHSGIIILSNQRMAPTLQVTLLIRLARIRSREQMANHLEFLANWITDTE